MNTQIIYTFEKIANPAYAAIIDSRDAMISTIAVLEGATYKDLLDRIEYKTEGFYATLNRILADNVPAWDQLITAEDELEDTYGWSLDAYYHMDEFINAVDREDGELAETIIREFLQVEYDRPKWAVKVFKFGSEEHREALTKIIGKDFTETPMEELPQGYDVAELMEDNEE